MHNLACMILHSQNKNDASFVLVLINLERKLWYCSYRKKRKSDRVRQERESAVDYRVTYIITSSKSFKNHARFMPDFLNLIQEHAKIFKNLCKIHAQYLARILPNLVRNFERFMLHILSIIFLNYLA